VARNVILSKYKNTFPFKNTFSMFLFLESRKQEVKSNMFSEFNILKMKIIFKKLKKLKIQTKHTISYLFSTRKIKDK